MVSPQDSKLLEEFRDGIKELFDDNVEDYLLLVYLRACDMNIERAREMFKRFLEIKDELTESDSRLDFRDYTPLEEISSDITYKFLGADDEGRLVFWVPVGRWNARTHVENGLKKELCLHCFKCADDIFYRLYVQGEETGKHQTIVVIADFDEISFTKIAHYETLQTGLRLLNDLQILAPLLHKVYIVNGPWITSYLKTLVSPFLASTTVSKLHILSSNPEEWKKFLRGNVPLQILPKEYGGGGESVLS